MRTGPGEFQLLPVGERAVAFVAESSDVEVLPGSAVAVRVHRGGARFVVSRDPDRRSFLVRTAEAEVAVLGTEFDVATGAAGTEVKVVRGEVEVRNSFGRRALWAGEGARVAPGGAPRIVLPVRGLVTEAGPVEVRPARR